ncbi:CNNM domain-containing protein, partial [Leucobacter sp. M11]|uniref:CNNM domain-containing protein n=1 Tax=Leucobacter sp. M11 TaxID=2993565 RepID=UPI002D80FCF6
AGSKRAKTALYAMEHATLMLATCQLGITVCSLLILNVSEPAIHHLMQGPLEWLGLSAQAVGIASFVIALVLVTYLHVVFGEMIPKNASFSVPDKAVLLLAPPLVLVSRVLGPITRMLNRIANGVLRWFKVEPKDEANSTFTLDEVANMVQHSTREGLLQDTTGALTAAFEFTTKKAKDLTLNRAELVTLPVTATPADVEAAVTRHGFSRYLLANASGELVGYVHVKDILGMGETRAHEPIPAKRVRSTMTVHEETDLEDALARLQNAGVHIARVLTADGTETGVLFLEDIIEELVGEVRDATRRIRFE